ncbi:FKBP-type peptidyl-prolyl cis-trans isomerase [Parapedobacter sp. DT-150]|uniref:FKBP-type peptidyl-prolyl cis-trans isomerase n=1 Tax=Parapedobacter sp. DT-150 TaxID=3396162 RepID=UPI003F1AEA65
MKKANVFVMGLLVVSAFSSCLKEEDSFDAAAQYELEKPIIEAYAMANLDNPLFHERTGIWYEIIEPGDPASYQYKVIESQNAIEAPAVWVNYEGRLVNSDTEFDSDDTAGGVKMSLAGVILAWQAIFFPEEIIYGEDGELLEEPAEFGGITESGLGAGAVVRIVTPSRWAYANQGQGSIPANAPLYFEITVHDIQEPDASGTN